MADTGRPSMDLKRIRTDFQLGVTVLFAAITTLGILPFATYRLVQGRLLLAGIEFALVLSMCGSCVYALRGGNVARLSQAMVLIFTGGCVVVAHLVPVPGMLWMYPVLLANFMLVRLPMAMLVSTCGILALLLSPVVFVDLPTRMLFLVTSTVTCLFAVIFAHRTNAQRAQLEELASHDSLTGIHNRRTLDRELGIAIDTYRRHLTPHGLALVDLDHFKRVNDTYGHEAGDRVLVDFAALVNRTKRRGDRFFRFGGEEFVLLLPGADAEALGMFCEHLRESVAAQLHCDNQVITVSIGAAALQPGEDAVAWLARADDATYDAKRRGRDCVVVADAVSVASRGVPRGTPGAHDGPSQDIVVGGREHGASRRRTRP